jgi:hypothetical protein
LSAIVEGRVEVRASTIGKPAAESGLNLATPAIQVFAEHA